MDVATPAGPLGGPAEPHVASDLGMGSPTELIAVSGAYISSKIGWLTGVKLYRNIFDVDVRKSLTNLTNVCILRMCPPRVHIGYML